MINKRITGTTSRRPIIREGVILSGEPSFSFLSARDTPSSVERSLPGVVVTFGSSFFSSGFGLDLSPTFFSNGFKTRKESYTTFVSC